MSIDRGAAIVARLDRLPPTRYHWVLILLISLGGLLEFYELSLTAYISPGLMRSGVFHSGSQGLLGMSDQATFAFATFFGLFVGTSCLGALADRLGRRTMFAAVTLWYGPATFLIAFQNTALGVDVWRFVAAIGLGVELVTVDAYLSELMPRQIRGRSYAFAIGVMQVGVPIAALLGWLLVPLAPFGFAGWRWMLVLGAVASLLAWVLRAYLPESPRWLLQHGRLEAAERVTSALERRVEAEHGPLPLPQPVVPEIGAEERSSFAELWRPPYRGRTLMLSAFQFCQTIGFYGFGNWLPALVAQQGFSVTRSLFYSVLITAVAPIAPMFWMLVADRVERKWQIVAAAAGTAILGMLFMAQADAFWVITLGILIVFSNSLLGYANHAYGAELFPTRIRARAVGFVYSWSRLSTAFTSLMIGYLLQHFGASGVFTFIAAAMLGVIVSIGVFGPRTRNRTLEEISR